jgi:hypothetical protein
MDKETFFMPFKNLTHPIPTHFAHPPIPLETRPAHALRNGTGHLVTVIALGITSIAAHASEACLLQPFDAPARTANHLEACRALPQPEYPPVSGDHYGEWAEFKEYAKPVAAGYWLHNLEHGGLVLLYNCPAGCSDEVKQLRALVTALPTEAATCSPTVKRAILAPDTVMSARFAVIGWGHSLSGDCLDSAAFHGFMNDHFRKAPEDYCSSDIDFSSTGWCAVADVKSSQGLHLNLKSSKKNRNLKNKPTQKTWVLGINASK